MSLSPSETDQKAALASPTLHWAKGQTLKSVLDQIVVEEPLAVETLYFKNDQPVRRLLGVTMRTPGQDEELALGLLHAEGLLKTLAEMRAINVSDQTLHGEKMRTVCIELRSAPVGDYRATSRTLVTTSACGLCGRGELTSLPLGVRSSGKDQVRVRGETILQLPERLRATQSTFMITGGCHGAAICDRGGNLEIAREDIGRHNAVDKVIGAALQRSLSLENKILLLSSRASFELIQKASVAGLGMVVAVGAPSSAAVELAHQAGITLIGFAREQRFNLYTCVDQIDLSSI